MAEKNINSRIMQKHDTEANWKKATNFIPKAGEIIIYDADDTYSAARIKVGNDSTNINDLPFINSKANWEQNDETALDYIQNRPFYDEIILPETTGEVGLNANIVTLPAFQLVVGEIYNVNYNGTEYVCKCFGENGAFMLGNYEKIMETGDSGEPFVVVCDSVDYVVFLLDGATSVTISISIIHKLDKKFLPEVDWNASEGKAGYIKNKPLFYTISEIFPETAITLESGGIEQLVGTLNIVANEQYIVSWNGIPYTCTATEVTIEGMTGIFLGNTGGIGLGGSDTGEPFCMAYIPSFGALSIMTLLEDEQNATITLKIEGKTPKLLYSYLPNDLYRTEIQWILPETTVTFEAEDAGLIPTFITLIPDATYTVYWKGTPYTVVAHLFNDDIVVLGNTKKVGGNDTGEPFLIAPIPDQGLMILTLEGDTSVTVGVGNEVIVKVPQKYLPVVSDDEVLAWLNEENIVAPVASVSGELYTTNNNKIYVL